MASPADLVTSSFAQAQAYANNATTHLSTFTTALSNTLYAPPTVSVTWNTIAPPTLDALPAVPAMPTIAFEAPTAPDALVLTAPEINISTFTDVAPSTDFGVAPTVTYGTAPTVPDVATITVPSAPTISMPSTPTLMGVNAVSFSGVDLHEAFLDNLTTVPTLTLVAPTPYSYSLGAEYASTLLSTLQAKLLSRLTGGSGLTPAVEQAIWDRARDRETKTAQGNIDQILRTADALGFQLPAGTVAAQTREAEQNYYDKLSELSRDVALKQADLEQANLKDTIAAGMDLEGKLIDYSFKLEQLTFESAKTYAENAIAVYNAQVENYKALLTGFQTYATVYKTIIDGQLAKVEVYKAELEAEQTKANIDNTLVQQYKAQIEASMATVELYKAQLGGAQTLMQLEQTKISAAGEQIRAYAAQVNAETAKVEAYKATVQAEATKIEVYKAKAQVFATTVGAQAEQLRSKLSFYESMTRAKSLEWDGYRAQVEAERSRLTALTAQSSTLLDGYKAGAAAIEAKAGMYSRLWETQIKDYEASQNVALQTAKINNDALQMTRATNLDAAKVGAQVYAQLAASAYSMIHASAGIQGSGSMSVNYSYSNDTTSAVYPTTSV